MTHGEMPRNSLGYRQLAQMGALSICPRWTY